MLVLSVKRSHHIAGEENPSFLRRLERVAESRFEVSLGSGEIYKCFSTTVSYCSEAFEATKMSTARHGAKEQHLCIRSHSRYKYMVVSRGSSRRVMAETLDKQRMVKELLEKAMIIAGTRPGRSRREVVIEMGSCFSSSHCRSGRCFRKRCSKAVEP